MSRKFLFLLLFLSMCFVTVSLPLMAADTPPIFGVFVGINRYINADADESLENLNYARNDAEALAEQFKKIGAKKTLLLTDQDGDSPTAKNILRAIEKLEEEVPKNAIFVISLSGHGVMIDGKSYFCSIETDIKDKDTILRTVLPIEDVYNTVNNKIAAKYKLMFVDACRNTPENARGKGLDNARGGVSKGIAIAAAGVRKNCILLQSCSQGQQSWEPDPNALSAEERRAANGYFTAAVLDCFRNSDEVSLFGLSRYVTKFTKDKSKDKQEPVFRFPEEISDFVLWHKPIEIVKERKAGDLLELTIKGVKYRFRWCPAGTFQMGSPESEVDRSSDESQHTVTLTRGFLMGETEVTQEMWESVMGDNPSEFKGAKNPVESVSWNDCQEFIEKINTLASGNLLPQGFKFALPTESQWEYACRAGTATAYCFGADWRQLQDYAWFSGHKDFEEWRNSKEYKDETYSKWGKTTHFVGTKKPNAWGLYDMHGNVWEWCSDWYGDYPTWSVTDPTGASSGSLRVSRGGGWDYYAQGCRSAYRSLNVPSRRISFLGLRLSLVSESR